MLGNAMQFVNANSVVVSGAFLHLKYSSNPICCVWYLVVRILGNIFHENHHDILLLLMFWKCAILELEF